MKERPILFSAPMVRAILAGKKTQTRRIVKPQPDRRTAAYWECVCSTESRQVHTWTPRSTGGVDKTGEPVRCPYGIAGDRLWVRETWFDNMASDDGDKARTPARCVYRADGEFIDQFPEEYMEGKWTPSIHMSRWASRITLEVVAVRVERLQNIKQSDIAREGIDLIPSSNPDRRDEYFWKFQELWESINGTDSWDANPWVWVVEFKRLEPTR